ncbi:MAG TPA: iron-containing redox enzyme family protein [Chloroflexota bacterium]|nr:iron-containing redox enzyme family protein [Chloroflexota bacterium]
MPAASLRQRLLAALEPRHCKHHPLIQAWARGELSRAAMALWAKEHYHYTHAFARWYALMIAACPIEWADARAMYLDTIAEEYRPGAEHKNLVLRFAAACGADPDYIVRSRPLPSTQALRDYLELLTTRASFLEMVVGQTIAQESQSVALYPPILPVLRQQFRPEEIAFFTEHIAADEDHGGRALAIVERYARPEEYDRLVEWVRRGADQRWFYFDGIYLQGVLGYPLGDPPFSQAS